MSILGVISDKITLLSGLIFSHTSSKLTMLWNTSSELCDSMSLSPACISTASGLPSFMNHIMSIALLILSHGISYIMACHHISFQVSEGAFLIS